MPFSPSSTGSMTVEQALEGFLVGYWSARTRENYAFILAGWFSWCSAHGHDPTGEVDPHTLEAWIGQMQVRGYAANTIASRVSAVSAFYRWCVRQQLCATATPST